jgi:cell division protein FtsB
MPMSSSQSPRHERDVVPAWPRGPRPSGVKNNQFTREKRSIGRRIVRTIARLFIAVLIGVGVTLAWQSHDAATSAELAQQLKPLTLDLAIVRHSLEQLAAKMEQLAARQEQMVQNITTLQAVEQNITQKISSPPQSRAVSPRKPPQPTAQSSAMQSSSVPPPPPPSGPPLRLLDGPAQSAR